MGGLMRWEIENAALRERIALTITAWNLWRKGESRKQIVWQRSNANGHFPYVL